MKLPAVLNNSMARKGWPINWHVAGRSFGVRIGRTFLLLFFDPIEDHGIAGLYSFYWGGPRLYLQRGTQSRHKSIEASLFGGIYVRGYDGAATWSYTGFPFFPTPLRIIKRLPSQIAFVVRKHCLPKY